MRVLHSLSVTDSISNYQDYTFNLLKTIGQHLKTKAYSYSVLVLNPVNHHFGSLCVSVMGMRASPGKMFPTPVSLGIRVSSHTSLGMRVSQ